MPRFSIITVCYNSSKTIKETIDSVKNQYFKDLEYIIIDGESTDDTLDIIKNSKKYIHKIISEKDHGIYDAMNKGIEIATGEIIGILNSDDLYANQRILEKINDAFLGNPEIEAVYGDLVYFRNSNLNHILRKWSSKPYYENFFEDGFAIPHPTLFVKKSVYSKKGVYFPGFKISSDYEFTLRVIKKEGIKTMYLNEELIKMRLGGESTSSIRNLIRGNQEIKESWKMNGLKFPKYFFIKKFIHKLLQLKPFNKKG